MSKPLLLKRLGTLLLGLLAGVAYAFMVLLLVTAQHLNVSVGYIFVLPLVLGALPVLFSTQEQLKSYWWYILLPWGSVLTFIWLCLLLQVEGLICVVIILGPFLLAGTLGAFLVRLYRLKQEGKKTPLYSLLALPLLVVWMESGLKPTDQFHTIKTKIEIAANRQIVWNNIKNVKNIQSSEIAPHFIHKIGVPKPLNGELDKEGIGGVRHITWEKGIRFKETITQWNEGVSFLYDIDVDPASIPPRTLDEHVMIGGRYFDVVKGGYSIDSLAPNKCSVNLHCTYRITTNLNFYSKWWADFILDDFQGMILGVIKGRSE